MGHSARKMSRAAHGQWKAQSGTLLLTSGADAAAHGPGGYGANKSSVLANCGLARPHSHSVTNCRHPPTWLDQRAHETESGRETPDSRSSPPRARQPDTAVGSLPLRRSLPVLIVSTANDLHVWPSSTTQLVGASTTPRQARVTGPWSPFPWQRARPRQRVDRPLERLPGSATELRGRRRNRGRIFCHLTR
jgi:hypothetical protein